MKPSSATSSSSTVEKLREFSKSSDLMDGAGELLRQAADELEEEEAIRTRMAALLAETAIALKGPEKPLHGHNWSNLPKIAAELKLACDIGEVLLEQERETRRSESVAPSDHGPQDAPMPAIEDESYPYSLRDGDIRDAKGRRVTVAGNLGVAQLLNTIVELRRDLRSSRSAIVGSQINAAPQDVAGVKARCDIDAQHPAVAAPLSQSEYVEHEGRKAR